MTGSSARQGHLAMLLFSVLIAGSFALGGRVAPFIDPAAFNGVRFVLAAGVVACAVAATGGMPKGLWSAPWRYLLLGGLYGFYFVTMFEALKTVPPVSTAAVFTLAPVMAAGFGWLMLRQVTTPWIALALAVGATGAIWVIFRADLDALIAFDIGRGEIVYFFGCMAHAAYTPAVRWLNRGEPILPFTFATLSVAAAMLVIWGAPEIVRFSWTSAPPIFWIALAYTAFAATSMTVFLVQYATLRLPAAKVMAYTYLVPSWVALWEIALGGALPGPVVLVGVGLTIVALLMLLRGSGQTGR